MQPNEQRLDYDHILVVLKDKRLQIEEAILAIEKLKLSEMGGRGTPLNWDAPLTAELKPTASEPALAPAKKKRLLSAAGKKRIIEANQKRWAEIRASKEAAGATVKETVAKAPRKAKTTKKSR
jgi:hypothetical protein